MATDVQVPPRFLAEGVASGLLLMTVLAATALPVPLVWALVGCGAALTTAAYGAYTSRLAGDLLRATR